MKREIKIGDMYKTQTGNNFEIMGYCNTAKKDNDENLLDVLYDCDIKHSQMQLWKLKSLLKKGIIKEIK